jgi:hypothetical protein
MAITTASGSKFYIGPVTNELDDAAGMAALTWVEVGEVETLGEFGDEASTVTFASIGDGRVRKLKGARDAGTMEITVGRDPRDAGQIAMKAAERTKFQYAMRVTAADAPDENDTDSVYYFLALVSSARDNYGENDNVVRTTFAVQINSEILEVASAAVP